MDELGYCKFCGGELFCGQWLFDGWKIFCRGCNKETQYCESNEAVIKAWNSMMDKNEF